MRKSVFITAIVLAGSALSSTSASAAETNFGCVAQLARANGLSPSTQAPGQAGNGPLTVLANGTIITANAFGGSTGC
jgi:hypothetical protein